MMLWRLLQRNRQRKKMYLLDNKMRDVHKINILGSYLQNMRDEDLLFDSSLGVNKANRTGCKLLF